MPELPEVQTVIDVLEPQIRGMIISNIIVNKPQVIAYPTAEEFCDRLTGQKIFNMSRRGKFITIHLASGD